MNSRRQCADLVFRRSHFYVAAWNKTKIGLWKRAEVIERVPDTVTDEELGKTIIVALDASVQGVEDVSWDQAKVLPDPLLQCAGVKSWSTFMKGALSCDIERIGSKLRFDPLRNTGGSFDGKPGDEFEIDFNTDLAKVGKMARKCIECAS